MYTLVLTCTNPAQLIGFYHQNKSHTSELSFAKLVPCSPKEALYAWGTPEDAGKVKYTHSDAGIAIYQFETSLPPYEWLNIARGCYPWLSICLSEWGIILIIYIISIGYSPTPTSRSSFFIIRFDHGETIVTKGWGPSWTT